MTEGASGLGGGTGQAVEQMTGGSFCPQRTSGDAAWAINRSESPRPVVPTGACLWTGLALPHCTRLGGRRRAMWGGYDGQEEGDGGRTSLWSLALRGKLGSYLATAPESPLGAAANQSTKWGAMGPRKRAAPPRLSLRATGETSWPSSS